MPVQITLTLRLVKASFTANWKDDSLLSSIFDKRFYSDWFFRTLPKINEY